MEVTVVITTKNRKEELRRALLSCRIQSVRHEVLVIDDGSSDGTSEMVRSEFPEVRLERHEQSSGYITQRNRAASLATGNIIISIDDDAEFSATTVIEETIKDINSDPRIGAVAIPYIEPQKANVENQRAPDRTLIWLTGSYIGTAHAIRKDLFLRLGAYRESLVHQGEEDDFCIRILNTGYHICLGNAPAIIHHESPKRDYSRMDYFGARNSVLFGWHNVPGGFLAVHMIGTTIKCLLWSLEPKRLRLRSKALVHAWLSLARFERRAVSKKAYLSFRRFRKCGPEGITPEKLARQHG